MVRFARSILLAAVACSASAACAQTPGFALADESYRFNEARRRDQISRQIDLNYRMNYIAGFGPQWPDPFEPWPRVPGDIWGYPLGRPIVHPVGHESVQVSPTRWIYRPVYATAPVAVPPVAVPATISPPPPTPVTTPRLPGPSDAVGPPMPIGQAAPAPGVVREF